MPIKPITPGDIPATKASVIPEFVIDAINKLIAAEYSGGSATITQNAMIDAIMESPDKNQEFTRQMIFDKGWLNVEEIYRAAGWRVVYDKPGYNESYDANFTFKATVR